MNVKCYACDRPALRQCPVCRVVYCPEHGSDRCLRCGGNRERIVLPLSPLASPLLFRGALLAVVVGVLLALAPEAYGRLGGTAASAPQPIVASGPTATPALPTAAALLAPQPSPSTATTVAEPTAAPVVATPVPTPTAAPTAVPTSAPTAAPTAAVAAAAPSYIVHRVVLGETLNSIAERYGLTTERLIALAGIANPDQVQEGQEIRIPQSAIGVPVAPPTAVRPQHIIYTVKPGESLNSIAERFGTTVQILVAYNGLRDADLVKEGQEIAIPQ